MNAICTIDALLAATQDGRWTPGIGDPTIIGWVTVVAYLLMAAVSARALTRCGDGDGWRTRVFWGVVALGLIVLGVNKQLDLQTWFTQTARDHAYAHGWYESRRTVQFWFIVGIALAGLGATLVGLFLIRWRWRALLLPMTGVGLLLAFIPARAATMHHVDRFLGLRIAGVSMNGFFELSVLALIAIGALSFPGATSSGPRRNHR